MIEKYKNEKLRILQWESCKKDFEELDMLEYFR